jgi:hypothetical protein
MKLKLLEPHMITIGPSNDAWRGRGTIIELSDGSAVTPLMEGLDPEAVEAVAYAHLKVFGRYSWPYGLYPPSGTPLDSPPIPRPLDDNQPVFHFTGSKEYL